MKTNTVNNKNHFLSELSNILFFWIIGVLFFTIFRLSFILIYATEIISNLSFSDFFNAFLMGFRFDSTVASYFLIIPFLATHILIPLKKVKASIFLRVFFQYIFSITSVIICIITLNYYKEYKDQFNHFLFMGLYDDKKAVFQSIISEYHPIQNGILSIIFIFILLKIFKFYEKKSFIYTKINSLKLKNIFIGIIFFILFIGAIRGSYTEYPTRRFYSAVTSDDFINKTIINPFRSLKNAISDYNKLNKSYGKNPFGQLPKSIQNNFKSIEKIIQKKTTNNFDKKPDQIFLVIMESYSSWSLMDKYKDLNVNTNLLNIEQKGMRFTNFLPASNSTMNSFSSIVTSIPYTGVNTSVIGTNKTYPSSIFEQFKKLGYETNFFYGGYITWQNINNFSRKQGADYVFGASNDAYNARKGIWGINDDILFKNVLSKVDKTKKSLNIILTTSYHSPYEVDVYAKGFKYKSVDDLPKKYKNIYNEDKMSLNTLGHLWYADKSLGKFITEAENKYPNSLFALTGDHFGRKFINGTPDLYEKSSVPFILYGNSIGKSPIKNNTPGSHIDIAPTIIDIVAPSNHTYYGFGNSLLEKNNIGIGFNKLIDENQLVKFSKNLGTKKYSLNKNKVLSNINYKKKYDSIMSLSWHYITKGNSIK